MTTKTFEIDLADGCLSGTQDVADRIEYAMKHYCNLESEVNPRVLTDKYRITVSIELMHPHTEHF